MSTHVVKPRRVPVPRPRLLIQAIRLGLALGAGVTVLPAHAVIPNPVTGTYTVTGTESTPSDVNVQSGGLIDIISPSGNLSNGFTLTTEVGVPSTMPVR